MPAETNETSLAALARHDVAPVVVGGHDETDLPRLGLVRVRDAETGRTGWYLRGQPFSGARGRPRRRGVSCWTGCLPPTAGLRFMPATASTLPRCRSI